MKIDDRDDSGLVAIICPHCRQTIPVMQLKLFEKQQPLYLQCEHCGEGINKTQIDNTYREYEEQI